MEILLMNVYRTIWTGMIGMLAASSGAPSMAQEAKDYSALRRIAKKQVEDGETPFSTSMIYRYRGHFHKDDSFEIPDRQFGDNFLTHPLRKTIVLTYLNEAVRVKGGGE